MNEFYCAAPWRGLHINPRGDVKTCCAGNPNILGNLNTQGIQEVLNSEAMIKIRRNLAQGRPDPYCSNCVKAEQSGAESERYWHNRVNSDLDYASAGDRYHWPTIFDVRWNTTCNFSCNYCGSACSSRWAAIRNEQFRSGTRPYYQAVCDFLEQHREHIHEVALVGGEPLLLPENERLLDVIPESAIVTLITNLNVDFERNAIVQKLARRSRVGWSMSMDNIGKRFEYVRHGGDWQLTQHNIRLVQQFKQDQGHWGGIHAVYNIYNCTRLCEFRQWAKENNLTILWQKLFQPDYLDPLHLGVKIAKKAADEIDKLFSLGLAAQSEVGFFKQTAVQLRLVTESQPNLGTKFLQHIHDNEHVWHPDKAGHFAQLWPELICAN